MNSIEINPLKAEEKVHLFFPESVFSKKSYLKLGELFEKAIDSHFRKISSEYEKNNPPCISSRSIQQAFSLKADALNFIRNCSLIIQKSAVTAASLGVLSAIASVGVGTLVALNGNQTYVDSRRINDSEGKLLGQMGICGGGTYAFVGIGLLTQQILSLSQMSSIGSLVKLSLVTPLSFALNLAFLSLGLYQSFQALRFRSQLNKAQKEGDFSALQFLLNWFSLTQKESDSLFHSLCEQRAKIDSAFIDSAFKDEFQNEQIFASLLQEFSGMSLDDAELFISESSLPQIQEKLHQDVERKKFLEIHRLLEKKKAILTRRTSPECAFALEFFATCIKKKLGEKINAEDLENFFSTEGEIAKARAILQETSKANFKKSFNYLVLVSLSLGGFALLFSSLLVASPALFALGALISLLWFFVDSTWISQKIGNGVWAIREAIYAEKQKGVVPT